MTTSKKTVAATTAANKSKLAAQVKMEKRIVELSHKFVDATGTAMGVIQMDFVERCRVVTRDPAEAAVLIAKYPRQRKSEAAALIALDDTAFEAMKSWAPKRRKLGLQIAARCNKVAQIAATAGFDPIHAADYIRTGKADSFTLAQGKALADKKPAVKKPAVKKPASEPTAVDSTATTPDAPRDVQLPVHNGKGKTPFMLLDEALAALASEYGASKNADIKMALALLQTTARQLIDATANEA